MARTRPEKLRSIQLGPQGRLVIPAPVRKALDLKEGDRLIVNIEDDGTLRLTSARKVAQALAGIFKDLAPGVSLAEDLNWERREEARQEEG